MWVCISGEISFAQVSAKIDFRRDVQPLFREHCIGCHGPTQQMNGFRLDQRRYVMPNRVGANGAAVFPGSNGASRRARGMWVKRGVALTPFPNNPPKRYTSETYGIVPLSLTCALAPTSASREQYLRLSGLKRN